MGRNISEQELKKRLPIAMPSMIHMEKLVAVKDSEGYLVYGIGDMVYVDEDIAELVEWLNKIDGVRTFSSCQGSQGDDVLISMRVDENLNICDVARSIFDNLKDICLMLEITVEWSSSSGNPDMPCLDLQFPLVFTREVTEAIKKYVGEENKRNLVRL